MVDLSARSDPLPRAAVDGGTLPVPTSSARSLGRRAWWAVAFVASLLVCHQLLLQPAIGRLTTDAPVINVAGRQRMLSQKLVKSAVAIRVAESAEERGLRREEFAATLAEWQSAQRGLQDGDDERGLPGVSSPEIREAYADLQIPFEAMVQAAERLLADGSADSGVARAALATLLTHEAEFLSGMHRIVGLHEAVARRHVDQLQRLGLVVMLAIVLVLVVLQVAVVRPAVRLVGEEFAQSEIQYQTLVESMSDGLVVFDPAGRVQFANGRFGTMLGQPRDELLTKPASVFVADADRRRFDGLLQQAGDQTGPLEISLIHAAGRVVDTIVSPRRLCGVEGEPQGLLLVVTDITERKAGERRSRELLDQLAHADRLKSMGEMAAALAHELNQPLGAIANYAEGALARLAGLRDTARVLEVPLQAILRATLRGGAIIRRARSFAQRRPHHLALESMNSLVREVEQLCLPEARRRGVSLELHLAENLPVIPVDGIQIQQVLTNLIQNAFDALEAVEPYRRRVRVVTRWGDSGDVEVRVVDTGPGIPREDAERMFEPFFTTRAEGTGMGLAIARTIVTAHGGTLWGERHSEGGAVFRMTLPRRTPTHQPAPTGDPAREMLHV